MKKEFVCVKPKSRKAKNRFANEMGGLHSCVIENPREMTDGTEMVFLRSINNRYFFWMPKSGGIDWEVVK